ncbi:hypothetical protein DLM78_14595 [Leptospira stimsonii]|uniref:Uncharacterized protein n=1 Tax=Leptospira stimsonii TaxID=2202203 RepID=A0A8B3CQM0_9LEPT|nr:hypothetical protein DLM78_14595 [Leptospira stimsonii]
MLFEGQSQERRIRRSKKKHHYVRKTAEQFLAASGQSPDRAFRSCQEIGVEAKNQIILKEPIS